MSATVHPDAPAPPAPPAPAGPGGSAAAAQPTRSRRDRRTGDAAAAQAVAADNGAAPAAASEPRGNVRWYWRLLAWVVAVPLGLVITAWPAYHFKWIKKDDLLDVFVGSGNSRYTRLVVLTLVWALVTALLVQLFVEGGRWIARRRRARKAAGGPERQGRGRGGAARPADPQGEPQPSAAPPARRPAASARR